MRSCPGTATLAASTDENVERDLEIWGDMLERLLDEGPCPLTPPGRSPVAYLEDTLDPAPGVLDGVLTDASNHWEAAE
ncbi:hypothetical protein NDU88_003281 [Pleurodeles waltl]|uniref:Uncharacterized protein n=1 Tax=Pleurodeles waltl TaxID=8319 RepID=A0AAV7RG46_PLEWA|nr:hypothetical protein NDU88_003281 [Pleurodeles waltl]